MHGKGGNGKREEEEKDEYEKEKEERTLFALKTKCPVKSNDICQKAVSGEERGGGGGEGEN